MAPSPALRFLLHHSRSSSSQATLSSIFPKHSVPVHSTLSVCFSSFPGTSATTQVTQKEENEMVYVEERLGNKLDRSAESVVNSSTIATIVTSLFGSPATVGIVRLSCPLQYLSSGVCFDRLLKRREGMTGGRPAMLWSMVCQNFIKNLNFMNLSGSSCQIIKEQN